ncbi:hypothetical protein QQF64_026988 [Cirrhinus molitorella]|uniref:Uncharacterized protein n=1 Tax=Cirrhinus molitorella TaxID=172907 RepID=A0ABR3NB40_9TELE
MEWGGKGEEKGGQRDYFPLFPVTTQASSGDPASDPFRLCETAGRNGPSVASIRAVEILLSLLSGVETPVTRHKAHWGRARERERTEQNHCIPQKKKKEMWRQKG